MIYQTLVRPFLFKMDPEMAHRLAFDFLRLARGSKFLRNAMEARFAYSHPSLRTGCFGLDFPNPVGLAAGFDKNCEIAGLLPSLGFGFVEGGTVTARNQKGNSGARVFRLVREEALINRLGFNNDGAGIVRERLDAAGRCPVPFGINIGKSKDAGLEQAREDYLFSFEKLYPCADYFTVNVSSPNTPGLRELEKDVAPLLSALQEKNKELALAAGSPPKPLLVKISPDLTARQVDAAADACLSLGAAGIIATNTTLSREGLSRAVPYEGGLSGKPLAKRSLEILRRLHARAKGRIVLVGVGGIFSAEEAYRRIRSGASLVQIYTSWIYRGPSFVSEINRKLAGFLARDGFRTLADAVGADAGDEIEREASPV